MNQDDFNVQGNGEITNNQSQIQGQEVNQSAFNTQSEMNSNYQPSTPTNDVNSASLKKSNWKLIVVIISVAVVIVIGVISFIIMSKNKDIELNGKNEGNNNKTDVEVNTNDDDLNEDSDITSNEQEKNEFEYVLKNNYSITDDWKECNIIIDGKTYVIGLTKLKELQNDGWEYNSNYIENQTNNGNVDVVKSNGEAVITIGNEKYGEIINAVVANDAASEQKIEDCRLKSIIINLSLLNRKSYPDIVIAGNISFSNMLQDVIDKHGKASNLVDKGDGYFSAYWFDTNSDLSYSKSMVFLVKETDDGILSSKILEIAIESK